mmetsp:Transcript_27347/g.61229  ORF Transcript_27347/g.61229 Transcript_27347/m.61229 type:complete len:116 (-) Transcript_27347:197-544(-)
MAIPGMFIPPVLMTKLEKTAMFIKNPWLKLPATVSIHIYRPACSNISSGDNCSGVIPCPRASPLSSHDRKMWRKSDDIPCSLHSSAAAHRGVLDVLHASMLRAVPAEGGHPAQRT